MIDVPPEPSAAPTVGMPDAATGAVRGSLNMFDPEGAPLTYGATSLPAHGSVTVDIAGEFVYTPTTAARITAARPAGQPTSDTFTIAVSDGVSGTPVTVTVPVARASVNSEGAIQTGDSPVEIAVGPDGRMYTSNNTDETISVWDPATRTSTAFPARPGPGPLAVSPDGGLIYVVNGQTGGPVTVSKVRTADNVTVAQVQIRNYSEGDIALSQNGTRLYVATDSGVTVINTINQSIVTNIPVTGKQTGIAITPDGTRLYVTGSDVNTVSVIDTATNTVVKTIAAGPIPTYGVALTPDGRRAYITNLGGAPTPGTVSALDTDSTSASYNTVIASVPTGPFPLSAVTSLDGSVVYVVKGSGSLSVIETATNKVIKTIVLGHDINTQHIALSPDGNTIYITARFKNQVLSYTVGAPTRDKVVDTITVPRSPFNLAVNPIDKSVWLTSQVSGLTIIGADRSVTNIPNIPELGMFDIDFTPDGRFAYVTDFGHSRVLVFDSATRALVTTIAIPNSSVQFIDISPDGRFAYVSVDGSSSGPAVNNVTIIDTATNTVVGSVPNQSGSPVTVSPDSAFFYVQDFTAKTILQVSTVSKTVTKTISVPGNVTFVAVSPDGKTLYAPIFAANPDGSTSLKVAVVDVATGTSSTIALQGNDSWRPVLSADGSRLYVPMSDRRSVAVIDTATKALVSIIVESGDNPRGLAVSGDGKYLYTANFSDDTVSVVAIA